jgi:hypothetical protein
VVQFNPQNFSISHISQLEKSKYMARCKLEAVIALQSMGHHKGSHMRSPVGMFWFWLLHCW